MHKLARKHPKKTIAAATALGATALAGVYAYKNRKKVADTMSTMSSSLTKKPWYKRLLGMFGY